MKTDIHSLDINLDRPKEVQDSSPKEIDDARRLYGTQVHSLIGPDLHTREEDSFNFSDEIFNYASESGTFNRATEQLIAQKLAEILKVLGVMTPQSLKDFKETQEKENKKILSIADVLGNAEEIWKLAA